MKACSCVCVCVCVCVCKIRVLLRRPVSVRGTHPWGCAEGLSYGKVGDETRRGRTQAGRSLCCGERFLIYGS